MGSFSPEFFLLWLSGGLSSPNALHVLAVFISTWVLLKFSKRFLFTYWVVTFMGTLFHELCHMIVSMLFGKFSSISLIPRKSQDGGYILGSVTSVNVGFFSAAPISMAPLLMVPCFFYIFESAMLQADFLIRTFFLYLSFIVLASSMPSRQDFIVLLSYPAGLLFYSGLIAIILIG